MTVIVDSGLGNVGSVANMIRKLGGEIHVARDPAAISKAEKLILPGVGHFDRGMSNLHSLGLVSVLNDKALRERVPVLGICLGMQLMCKRSEEGETPGLGWVDACFKRFSVAAAAKPLKIPHMGWNWVEFVKESPLTRRLTGEQRFYFVHSYYMRPADSSDVLGVSDYGGRFPAAFQVGNLYGVQFHPEKSHRFGLALLASFMEL
jgi:imidazole glycerol-phosphate synthase subunit HisH